MMQRLSLALTMLLVLLMVPVAHAQQPPPALQFALDDLSLRTGATVALEDVASWTWERSFYDDTSLGCPQPDMAYAQVVTPGYQFLITYQGTTFDYRVSDDGQIVILCQQDQLVPTPTLGPAPTLAPTLIPTPMPTQPAPPAAPDTTCPDALPPRLNVGDVARTTPGVPSNLRSQGDLSGQVIDQVPGGAQFQVVAGPVCGPEGLLWWEITYNNQQGWVAQGEVGIYYVERVPDPLPLVTELGDLTAQTFGQVRQLSLIQGNVTGAAAWSPDGLTLAVANTNTALPGVWLYDLAQLAVQAPRLLPTEAMVTTVAFTPDGTLVVGNVEGVVEFWDSAAEEMIASFDAHEGAVLAITFSPDGRMLATLGEDTTVRLWGVPVSG